MEKASFPIAMMCRLLEVSRSGYYAWGARAPRARALRNAEPTEGIRRVHKESRGTYGSPRVYAHLLREGFDVKIDTVARLMRLAGLTGRIRRKFKVTTDSKHDQPIAPNLVNREFEVETTDSAWCADITYIRTASGWVYLAVILDLASRLVVGWSMARHMRTELITSALAGALAWRMPAAKLVHHSDRGSQYASDDFRRLLKAHGIKCSMSRKGNCWDNAVVESFFGTFKQELYFHESWSGLAEARAATADYITPMEADEASQ